MNVKSILGANAFWTLNKTLVKKIGNINAAFFLTYLIDKEDYHRQRDELKTFEEWGEDFFYCAANKAQEKTTLTTKQQTAAIKILESAGLIMTILKGTPATKHFKLNHSNILDFILGANKFSQIDQTRFPESTKLDFPNRSNYNTKNIIIKTEEEKQNKEQEVILPNVSKKELETTEALLFLADNYKKRNVNIDLLANRAIVGKCLNKFSLEDIKRGIFYSIQQKIGKEINGKSLEQYIKVSTIFAIENMSKYVSDSEGQEMTTDDDLEKIINFGEGNKYFYGKITGDWKVKIKGMIAEILSEGEETKKSICELIRFAAKTADIWKEWEFLLRNIKNLRKIYDKFGDVA